MAEIRLYEQGGATIKRRADDSNVAEDGTFVSAEVVKGQWILYDHTNYNPDSVGSSQVLTEGEGKGPLHFTPKSLRSVKSFGNEGVTVYKPGQYGGLEQACYSNTSSILKG